MNRKGHLQGRLIKLSPSQRAYVAGCMAECASTAKALVRFMERYPDAHEYPRETLLDYKKTAQYKHELAVHYGRDFPAELPFAQRPDRIKALTSLLVKNREYLEDPELATHQKISLSNAQVRILDQLKSESEPFDEVTTKPKTPFETAAAKRIDERLDKTESLNDGVEPS